MLKSFEGLDENFRFLILEVQNQIKATIEFLLAPTPATYDKIFSKDDYIDNLKNVIENKCFTTLNQTKLAPDVVVQVIGGCLSQLHRQTMEEETFRILSRSIQSLKTLSRLLANRHHLESYHVHHARIKGHKVIRQAELLAGWLAWESEAG